MATKQLIDPTLYGDRVASIYDTEYAPPDPSQVVTCLARLAKGGAVLELGMGTGRVALPLHAQGIPIEGVELSGAMIEQLKSKPGGDQIPVVQGDFAEVCPAGPFTLIFAAYNTFFHLETQEKQIGCFRRMADRLQPGGQFVIECFVPDQTRLAQDNAVETVEIHADKVWLAASKHDSVNQTITRSEIFLGGEGVQTFPIQLRYAWPAELDLMARLAGLTLRERWSDWEGGAFGPRSRKHISIYQAP